MSTQGATPAAAPAANADATTPAQSGETAVSPTPDSTSTPADNPAPSFVQSAQQTVPPVEPQANQHAPKPELVSGDWREMIPMDLRQDAVWDRYHSPEQAFRGLVEAQKLIGKKEIPVGLVKPDANASQEEQSKFQLELSKMLGVPDSSERYTVPESAEGLSGLDKLMAIAHKSGIGNDQFKTMIDQVAQADAEHMKQREQVQVENMKALRDEWGASYEQNLEVADIGLDAVDKDGSVRKLLAQTGLNTHPVIIKHYHELGAQFREGTLKTGEASTKETTMEKIEELKRKDAYWEQGLDGGATRREVDRLMKEAGLR